MLLFRPAIITAALALLGTFAGTPAQASLTHFQQSRPTYGGSYGSSANTYASNTGHSVDRLGRALYIATDRGNLATIQALLKQGADPSYREPKRGNEPVLLRALTTGRADIVSLLLSYRANPDALDGRGTPILVSAATLVGEQPDEETPDPRATEFEQQPNTLRSHRAELPILSKRAARLRSERIIDAIQVLLEQGHANANASDTAYIGDDRAALHIAAASGSLRLVRLLLKFQADPNRPNRHDETPIFFAAEKGHADIAYELMQWRARIDLHSRHTHMTPLMVAAESGQPRVVKLLLYFKSDLNSRNTFGKTSLDLARAAYTKNTSLPERPRFARVVRLIEKAMGVVISGTGRGYAGSDPAS